ncbi:MAG: transporter substrate-binding domain-containing protein [Pontiellaceae bacterium]|nr:transporter substrate-binding domain-containing protein [Pontiellaceae bacterium]MBN2784575.1 transporter substrate-binding domain-containing protein [Pontiellaceae bacterium]
MKKSLCLLAAGMISCVVFQGHAETIKLATLEWEPYVGKSLVDNGFIVEITREAFKRSGYEVELTFLPWKRALSMVENGSMDGCFPSYHIKERENIYLYTENMGMSEIVLFKKAEKNITFNALEDLKPYTIGVVGGYGNSPEFDAADYLKKQEVTEDILNFQKLKAGRLDLVVADKYFGLEVLNKKMPEMIGKIDILPKPINKNGLVIGVSKKIPNGAAIVEAFNKGMKEIKADGTYDKIMEKHGFKQ